MRFLFIIIFFVLTIYSEANVIETNVQEKVYLHIDNNCYEQGDTIWYKAYVVEADGNRATTLSRILYVELLDEQGYLVERQQLVVDFNGQANGQFALSSDAFPGHYELRAYTKWMMNFGWHYDRSWSNAFCYAYEGPDIFSTKKVYFQFDPFIDNILDSNVDNYSIIVNTAWEKSRRERNVSWWAKSQPLKGVTEHIDEGYTSIDAKAEQLRYRCYDYLFSRVVSVYQRQDSAKNYLRKVMPRKVTMGDYEIRNEEPKLSVRFFPESGYVVEGLDTRIAWEAKNEEGRRMNLEGVLLDGSRMVDSLHSIHSGRGMCSFVPLAGHTYKARFLYDGKHYTFNLPETKKTGCVLSVRQREGKASIAVKHNIVEDHQLSLLLSHSGKWLMAMPLKFSDGESLTVIDLEQLPAGVNQATVMDEQEMVLADRLFFVENEKINALESEILTPKQETGNPKALNKQVISFVVKDRDGSPAANQTFSIAVRDKDQLDDVFSHGNIMTNLLLQSELRGFVENPEQYFNPREAKRNEWLDLLMMVQGWRRYDWKDIVHPDKFSPDYMPERTTTILGQAYSLRTGMKKTKLLPSMQIFCSLRLLGERNDTTVLFQGYTMTDSLGQFGFTYKPFYGNAQLILRGKFAKKVKKENGKGKKYDLMPHDENIFIRREHFFPNSIRALNWYETHTPDIKLSPTMSWDEYQRGIYSSVLLPQVNIRSKKRPHARRQQDRPVQRMAFLDFVNDIWDMGYYNTYYKADNKVFDFSAIESELRKYIRHQYNAPKEVLLANYNWAASGNTKSDAAIQRMQFLPCIDSLYFVTDDPRRPVPYYLYHLDRRVDSYSAVTYGISAYYNITERPDGQIYRMAGREYRLKGFNQPAEFYSPVYAEKAQTSKSKSDHRRTLYWNPSVTTDSLGQATITFYNSAVCTDFDISIEGITKDGRFILYH